MDFAATPVWKSTSVSGAPASPRRRAGVASMAWRSTRRRRRELLISTQRDANLVRLPRKRPRDDESGGWISLAGSKADRTRKPRAGRVRTVSRQPPLASPRAYHISDDDALLLRRPRRCRESNVDLGHAFRRERVADGRGGPPALGEDEAAARAVVESMGELQILRAVHEFEDARLVVASMTGHAGRFVDDEVVRTFGDDWDRRRL